MEDNIVNRVANSGLVQIDLEDYYDKHPRAIFDIKDALENGFVLREKTFRTYLQDFDWSVYENKNVAVVCTADAIIPQWASLLVASYLQKVARFFVAGSPESLELALFQNTMRSIDPEKFRDAKVLVKGCGKYPVPDFAFAEITRLLQPVVSSLMYGESCSTVPIFKKVKAVS